MAACMMEQLDHLVEHDGDGRHTHAMLKGEREKTKGIQWCSMQTLGCFRQRVRLQLFLSLYGKTQSHIVCVNSENTDGSLNFCELSSLWWKSCVM